MSTQNENLFVKLVKKSVGLPTGTSDCCSAIERLLRHGE